VWEHPKAPTPNPTGASLGAAAKTQQWPKWLGSITLWHGGLAGVFLGLHLGGFDGIHGDLHAGLHGFHGGKLRSHGCTGQEMDAPTGGGTGELGALEWLPQKKSKHMIICKHKIGFDCHHGNPYGLPIWFIIMEMHMLFKWVMQWGDIEVSWNAT
jgi:hypothetical protein